MDRFEFRFCLKLATQNIVIYSSFLKNYDDELVLSITEDYFKEQIYKAGYKLTKEDWKLVDSYSDQDDYYPMFNFNCEIIEQCTGLKDKNGKLIYEGDIVKLSGKYEIGVYPIVYNESCCDYELTKNDKFIYEFYWEVAENCEVIGNIHENKDLLELKNDF